MVVFTKVDTFFFCSVYMTSFMTSHQCKHENMVPLEAPYHEQKRSTEGCSNVKSPEARQVHERSVSTLEHMQVQKWDRTRCPEE